MGDSRAPRAAAGEPPGPDGVASLDELIERLQALRVWAGVTYRELHRRLVRRRRSRGIPEEPAYATVYRCFQTGRRRIDIDLVTEIVAELTGDDSAAARWLQAHAQLDGKQTTAAHATVLDRLPDDPSAFTGRDTELNLILDHARQAGGIIAIEGMAGVGKTTLAVRAAHRILDQDGRIDLVLSVHLHGHDPDRAPVDPTTVLDGFLRLLGMTGGRIQTLNRQERTQAFREVIADKAAVILLDDAADEGQVLALLPRTTSCHVLVTSRRRILRDVPARHIGLDVFTPTQALGALAEHLGEPIPAGQDEVAARLVAHVGHLPLAIALVAARMASTPAWTLDHHVEHLAERRDGLRLDTGIELAFAASYEVLRPSLSRMLRLLALHPGRDCDAYAAAALADVDLREAAGLLGELRAASLANERVIGRFELHDLVRMFAANRLREEDAPSARRAALTRLFDYQRQAVATAVDAYAPEERKRRLHVPEPAVATPGLSDRQDAVTWLDAEWSNVLAVVSHAAEHGWAEHVGQLSAVLAPYLHNAAKHSDAEIIHGHASRITAGAARGVALKNLAAARWHLGKRREALRLSQEALALSRAHGDRINEARALMNLAIVQRHLGDYGEAVQTNARALDLLRQLGDEVGYARTLGNLGILYSVIGTWDEAFTHLELTLTNARRLGDSVQEARTLENLARLYNRFGRYDDALGTAEQAISIAQRLGDPVCEAESLISLGAALAGQGDRRAALDLQHRGLAVTQEVGSRSGEVYAELGLASTLRQSGDLDAAARGFERALALAAELVDPHGRAQAHEGLARTVEAQGDIDRARRHAEEAIRLYRSLGTSDVDNVAMYLSSLDEDSSSTRGPQ